MPGDSTSQPLREPPLGSPSQKGQDAASNWFNLLASLPPQDPRALPLAPTLCCSLPTAPPLMSGKEAVPFGSLQGQWEDPHFQLLPAYLSGG